MIGHGQDPDSYLEAVTSQWRDDGGEVKTENIYSANSVDAVGMRAASDFDSFIKQDLVDDGLRKRTVKVERF